MDVDFNGLRKQLALSFDELVRKLNHEIDNDGYINIHVRDLQNIMDQLRESALMPCHTWIENEDKFILLSDWLDKMQIPHFNPNEIE